MWGFLFFISTVQTCLHEYEWKIKRQLQSNWFLFEEEWPPVESVSPAECGTNNLVVTANQPALKIFLQGFVFSGAYKILFY